LITSENDNMKDLLNIDINSSFTKDLPADNIREIYSRQVHGACFSNALTRIPSKPEMVHFSSQYLNELALKIEDENEFLKIVSGEKRYNDFQPYAMCYGGHQFGNWAGQLGDGRAINIADIEVNNQPLQLQLKGAGPTPYSRGSDGLAVLRSSIREYLCSEAMHNLGVPTTRALSLIKTGDLVTRDMLYNGNPENEHGAVVCRVAPSFIRFGNFQIFAARGEIAVLTQLVNYTIKYHFSHLGQPSKKTYLSFFEEVANKTRDMIVHWQRVGFVHGVMNTDNLSILGLTIDYGPYGWLEDYNPGWTPNTTDAQHSRYRFGNQPNIALWNLTQLANALYPLIDEVEPLQAILNNFKNSYLKDYHSMMTSKLGLYQADNIEEPFINQLTVLMTKSQVDMTIFYRELSQLQSEEFSSFWKIVQKASYLEIGLLEGMNVEWKLWQFEYVNHLTKENLDRAERQQRMLAVNPKYVLRNYMAQLAIDGADNGNYQVVDELYQLLLKPYDDQPTSEKWYAKRPEWAKHKAGCSMLSCSS
jgi:serine/tyrosine/threonine adenylyltransferase